MEVITWGDQLYMLLDCRSEERCDPSVLFVALVQDKGKKRLAQRLETVRVPLSVPGPGPAGPTT